LRKGRTSGVLNSQSNTAANRENPTTRFAKNVAFVNTIACGKTAFSFFR
jgi:hypothetical protein